ncbi:MAG TPA: HlyD family secretion protein [Polyangiaceae bacterium]|jgi:membrane fusion protein (multidrug efflux system)|nr:HlyD family secretion protein [Polyangiaceae bacterium]
MDTTSTERIAPKGAAAAAAPGAPASEPAAAAPTSQAPAKPKGGGKKRVVFIAVAVVAAIAGTVYYLDQRHFEETDDAQIDGDISSVGARISGTVTHVAVREGQEVKAGDLLVELDPSDYQVLVEQAEAQVAQAEAQLKVEDPNVDITEASNLSATSTAQSSIASASANVSAARQQVSQLAAQLEQARATDRQAQLDRTRDQSLLSSQAISQAEFDRADSAAAASAAGVRAMEQSLAAAKDRVKEASAQASQAQAKFVEVRSNAPRELDTKKASLMVRKASLDLARVSLRQAELNLSYTRVASPVDGIVSKKAVSIGDRVAPGQQLFAISQTKNLWVTANFRETQLRDMRPGQRVEVHVDALGVDMQGSILSITGATGSRLSILPPENASGNFVKVVQRIPVRIQLDPNQSGKIALRPGMSVEPKVKVR